MSPLNFPSRRAFLQTGLVSAAGIAVPGWTARAASVVTSDAERPQVLQGLTLGDPHDGAVVVWSRTDRPARMLVEWSYDEQFREVQRLIGPYALETTDFTARQGLTGLEPGSDVFVRVAFESLTNDRARSAETAGRLVVPPDPLRDEGRGFGHQRTDLRFVWGGDTAGQGWGINPGFGGMKIYEAMRQRQPLFFIHSGDTIYADGPIAATVPAENGQIWTNIVTPQVAKVAETLDEFRGRYRYNLLDENVRRFNAEVPQIWQWDDHEVANNWSDSKDLTGDARYTEKNVPLLTARGARAFLEYAAMRPFTVRESQRVYRRYSYGPLLELFVLDMRSYRGPNSANLETVSSARTAFLGREQLDWLKAGLEQSRAVWKVIAADMPLGLNVQDGTTSEGLARWEAVANGDSGAAKGRELEFVELLAHLKRQRVRNVVWLTADVHYCAAHHYDPARAAFRGFDPFWEFVAGPLNAGTFGPNALDGTFGPQVVFAKTPPAGLSNLSPYSGYQFFGEVNIDAQTRQLTVDLRDLNGVSVFSKSLSPRFEW
ncbi:MAG: alkaline phosphatase D family protein [Vicinamibacterales bacterium]